MRCSYGGTPQCKVNHWRPELEFLRQLVLETGLTEEVKWSVPVYTHNGKNIVSVAALKDFAVLSFFKGVLLKDVHAILQQQGSLQLSRIIKFTNTAEIKKLKDVIRSYIMEAVAIEKSGKKAEFQKNPEPIPNELSEAFEQDSEFKKAFFNLTPGRQRGYIIYFSQPKRTQTRCERIEKYKSQIFYGFGHNDRK